MNHIDQENHLTNEINAFIKQRTYDKAKTALLAFLEKNPRHIAALFALGSVYFELDQFKKATHIFLKIKKLNSGYPNLYDALGQSLARRGLYHAAIIAYQRQLSQDEKHYSALTNLIYLLFGLNKIEEAKSYLDKALMIYADDSRLNLFLVKYYFMQHDLLQAWRTYEKRRSNIEIKESRYFFSELAFWDGTPSKNKTLYLFMEQGVGDEVMLLSCLEDLLDDHPKVVVACDKRLKPIFSRSFPSVKFVSEGDLLMKGEVDYQATAGSLFKLYRSTPTAFAKKPFYLLADLTLKKKWQQRFATLPSSFTVGISWYGGSESYGKADRYIELVKWLDCLKVKNINWVNLQYDKRVDELAALGLAINLYDWPDSNPLIDFDNFFAEIAALDAVICVDNSTAHFAGALGVPTYLLLSANPDWRWQWEKKKTLWYPSVELIRSNKPYFSEQTLAELKKIFIF